MGLVRTSARAIAANYGRCAQYASHSLAFTPQIVHPDKFPTTACSPGEQAETSCSKTFLGTFTVEAVDFPNGA